MCMGFKFGKDFVFGFSESGFQFEMGLPGSEYESDWWIWVHDPENIAAGIVSGDLPENGPAYWHLYRQDHDWADRLGMDAARLGVEWARIFPKPTFDVPARVETDKEGNVVYVEVPERSLEELDRIANREAVQHYREIFADWRGRGKKLIVNLYHWPLPTWLHDPVKVRKLGPDRAPAGWLDGRSVDEFTKFAAYIAWKLGDLADMWSTMNEPNVVYSAGYVNILTGFPPGYLSLDAAFRAAKNIVEAHARAYDVVKKMTGKPVGVIYAFMAVEPAAPSEAEAAEAAWDAWVSMFLDSITLGRSPLVGEREDLRGRADWIGVNYYSRMVVKKAPTATGWTMLRGYGFACTPGGTSLAGRPCSDFGWEVYPEGLYKVLRKVWERYRVPIIVTENGVADAEDRLRPRYLVSHLYQVWRAVSDGIDVRGYLHWALVDNYEWAQGFRMRFGLLHVDFETKKRYARPSAYVFREIAKNKEIPDELEHLTKW